ncbi:hypothetical protein CYMTET_10873 [Cymbomonas tetramitiformis]|uniref:Tryptophan synthase beta chain-like PALP domain-containing protein n=1 Tax=Cymbomonas tetramitiformis TaxID=36881 RepID=A0AAE0LE17_9CHLO|nr:hypothetical protein CYMTET_10873 [Cymbomonas tetramitiformis]
MVAAARGYKCLFTMPEDISAEKIELMRTLGAEVRLCPCVPFSDSRQYVHAAKRIAETLGSSGYLTSQFENLANYRSHLATTGPEIWEQTSGRIDGFVSAAGVSEFLKSKLPKVQVHLIDPPGSGLKSFVENGVFQSSGSCHIEGIGIMRKTANFEHALIDGAMLGTDEEAIEMGYYLLRNEGFFVGPSAALNVCGAVKLARKLGPGHTIVTILCDTGERYRTKMYNPEWLKEKDLVPKAQGRSLDFLK